MLLKRSAQKITEWCSSETDSKEINNDVTQYGVELFLENLIRVIILVILGATMHQLLETVVFLVCFPILRIHAGGLHAKTSLGCTLIMLGGIGLCSLAHNSVEYPISFAVLLNIFNNILIILFAPNGSSALKLTNKEYYHKKKVYALVVNNVLWLLSLLSPIRNIILITLLLESLSLLVYHVKEKGVSYYEKHKKKS